MTERLSLIESSTPRPGSDDSTLGVFRIRPQVVDTSMLLPDVAAACRTGCLTKFLSSVEFGSVRPFAGWHVWAEVPRKIEERAAEMGYDRLLAEAIWWDEYVPRLNFVDTLGLEIPRPEILVRDASDAPTVALAGLLGEVVVAAADRDLRDIGVAATDWITTIEAGYALSVAGSEAWGGMLMMRVSGYSLAGAGRAGIKIVRHPVGQIVLAGLLIGLFLTRERWMPRTRSWLKDLGPRLDSLVETFSPLVGQMVEDYRRADATWTGAAFAGQEEGLLQRVARMLASSPHPLNRTEMTRRLYPSATERERRAVMVELARLLPAYPAFVRVNSRDWQLGRSGMDFGRDRREVSLLKRPAIHVPYARSTPRSVSEAQPSDEK